MVKNQKNGKIVAVAVSIIFMLFFVLNLFSKSEPDPEEIAGIMIQFGEEDMGMEDDSDPFAEEPNLETFAEEEVVEEVDEVVEEVAEPAAKEIVTDDASEVPIPKKTEKKPVKKAN